MSRPPDDGSALLSRIRLAIYRSFVDDGGPPSPLALCERFELAPAALTELVRELETQESAIVLLPDSPYLWMAEPFSAVPTHFEVTSEERRWFGNCIWDALAILALVGRDGRVETRSPVDGVPLSFEVLSGSLVPTEAVIHFAVPASDWWKSIGHT